MAVQRITNGGSEPLVVWVEPWCDELRVPPGSTLTLIYELAADRDDLSSVEATDAGMIFWCGGRMYRAELDGKAVPV